MSIAKQETNLPHIFKLNLYNDGIYHECAVLKVDQYENTYFIKIADLDAVDKRRLGKILGHRYVNNLPLWDIMDQTTFNNGMNALVYFHQLVKAVNADGKAFAIRDGQTGGSVNRQMAINAENQKIRKDHADTTLAAQELERAREIIAKSGAK